MAISQGDTIIRGSTIGCSHDEVHMKVCIIILFKVCRNDADPEKLFLILDKISKLARRSFLPRVGSWWK